MNDAPGPANLGLTTTPEAATLRRGIPHNVGTPVNGARANRVQGDETRIPVHGTRPPACRVSMARVHDDGRDDGRDDMAQMAETMAGTTWAATVAPQGSTVDTSTAIPYGPSSMSPIPTMKKRALYKCKQPRRSRAAPTAVMFVECNAGSGTLTAAVRKAGC